VAFAKNLGVSNIKNYSMLLCESVPRYFPDVTLGRLPAVAENAATTASQDLAC